MITIETAVTIIALAGLLAAFLVSALVVSLRKRWVEDAEFRASVAEDEARDSRASARAAGLESTWLRGEVNRLRAEGTNANEMFQRRCNEMMDQWKAEGEMVARGLRVEINRLTDAVGIANRAFRAETRRANRAENEANRLKNELARAVAMLMDKDDVEAETIDHELADAEEEDEFSSVDELR